MSHLFSDSVTQKNQLGLNPFCWISYIRSVSVAHTHTHPYPHSPLLSSGPQMDYEASPHRLSSLASAALWPKLPG